MSSLPPSSPPLPLPPPHRAALESLPRPVTSFIGREREIVAIHSLLQRDGVRLVTLTGPGGVGKTRLAFQAGRRVGDAMDAIWFVALASVRTSSQIPHAIARAIGMVRITEESIGEALVAEFSHTAGLLILDNLEQLPGAGKPIAAILNDCPNLKILATSRAPVNVSGEHLFAVPAMCLPIEADGQTPQHVENVDAVRLFVERARARSASFVLTDQNAPVVADICRQLDGLPLAIELAAARVDAFSPATLRRRLSERLTLLADGPRNESPRLRSMRDSIAWSHDLLRADERSVFAQLAVFAGPWTLEGAEAVVQADALPGHRSVLECVIALIQHNLIRRESDAGGSSYYLMLETIRQFAREMLSSRSDEEDVHRRHAMLIRGLAEQAEVAQFTDDGAQLYGQLRAQLGDIQQALAWMERCGDVDTLIQSSSGLRALWGMQGCVVEGRPWLERAVVLGRMTGSPMLGTALIALATNLHMQGSEVLASTCAEEGMSLIGPRSNVMSRFAGLTTSGLICLRLGDFERSASFQQSALNLIPELPPTRWVTCAESTILGNLGNIDVSRGRIEDARNYFDRALERQATLGLARGTSHFLANHPIAGLGDVARAESDEVAALALYRESLAIARRFNDLRAMVYALGGVAGSLAGAGRWDTAATLFGACEQHHIRVGFHFDLETMDRQRALGLPEPWQRANQSFGANQQLRDAIAERHPRPLPPVPDPESAAELWSTGRNLSLDEAIGLALAAPPLSEPAAPPGGLTPREREVLSLIVQGKTDREIAARLFISRRTASTHVRHIYDKLDVSSRAEATSYAHRHGLA